jgi:hypothetical protein
MLEQADTHELPPVAGAEEQTPSSPESSTPASPVYVNPSSPEAAFENFYHQGTTGYKRSLVVTANSMKVPIQTIRKWHRDGQWDMRCADRDYKIAQSTDAQMVQKVSEIKARYHQKLASVIEAWFEKHTNDPEKLEALLLSMDVDDVVKAMKMSMTLLGQPDTIKQIENTGTVSVEEHIKNLSTEDLRRIINMKNQETTIDVEPFVIGTEKQDEPKS